MKNNYELKQSMLDKLEIEGLVDKIQRLEKQLALKELEVRQLEYKLNFNNTDKLDNQISKMFSKLHL